MVMRIGNAITILRVTEFAKVVSDLNLRDEITVAYFGNQAREFTVTVTTDADAELNSTFTAAAIVQLSNQRWVKSIRPWSVASLC